MLQLHKYNIGVYRFCALASLKKHIATKDLRD